MSKKPILKPQERAIIKVLHDENRWMSIKEVADKAKISWVTARKYLEKLFKNGVIEKED